MWDLRSLVGNEGCLKKDLSKVTDFCTETFKENVSVFRERTLHQVIRSQIEVRSLNWSKGRKGRNPVLLVS